MLVQVVFIPLQSYNIFLPNPNSHRVERGVEWGVGNWRLALSETVNNDQRTCERRSPCAGPFPWTDMFIIG